MSEKQIKARVQLKNDTAQNWATASDNDFIPKLGEPIFYKEQDGDGFKFPKMKIGDGVRTPDELPSYSGSWNDLTDKPTIPSIEGLATEEYVDNAIANAGGGSGGAGYGNAPIQRWNFAISSEAQYSPVFTQTGNNIYEAFVYIGVIDECGQSYYGTKNILLGLNNISLAGYEIFKNIVVRPSSNWYWTTVRTDSLDANYGDGYDTDSEFVISANGNTQLVLQLYNKNNDYSLVEWGISTSWGLKVKIDTEHKIISLSIAEGGSVLF